MAATLLDLKVAALLPREARPDDPEEQLRLEARDLLFARLLQHRAFAAAGERIAGALARQAVHVPRPPARGPDAGEVSRALPELDLRTTGQELAALAAAALTRAALRDRGSDDGAPRGRAAPAAVDLSHLHAPRASVPEQVALLAGRLRGAGQPVAFDALAGDAGHVAVVVGRFLAVLELFRTGSVDLDQRSPGEPLLVRWVGA